MGGWLVHTLVSSSVLMALVLLVRAPVARAFGARTAYALWLLPALRMVLPPIPGWSSLYVPVLAIQPAHTRVGLIDPVSAVDFAPYDALPAHSLIQTLAPAGAPPPSPVMSVAAALCLLWLTGALLCFGWQMLRYRGFIRRSIAGATLLTRIKGIEVWIGAGIEGPVAGGIRHRRIFLPADFSTRYTPDERRLALLHEGAHHDRHDILANLIGLAVVALHWWNPLAHRAYRAFRADQELACDATVLAGTGAADRHAYGSAILKSACVRTPAAACALNHKSQLKQRILMMKAAPHGFVRLVAGGLLATAAIGGGLLLTAVGTASARIASPAAPAAPRSAFVAISDTVPPAVPAAPMRAADPIPPLAPVPPVLASPSRQVRAALAEARRAERAADRAHRQATRAAARAEATSSWGEARSARALGEQIRREVAAEVPSAAAIRASVDASLRRTRSALVAKCAAAATPVAANADFGTLATCGQRRAMMEQGLRQARLAIASEPGLTDVQRAQALAGVDRALARQRQATTQP